MGLTVNPISNRLNISIFWKSKWCTYSNYNYKYLVLSDLIFLLFFIILLLESGFRAENLFSFFISLRCDKLCP